MNAYMSAHLRLLIEQFLEVRDAGVRRLPLDEVVRGLAEDDTVVDAAPSLCRQHFGGIAESLGGNGLCGCEGVR